MAVPKKRTAKSKRNSRRSHHGVRGLQLSRCPQCSEPVPSHTTCLNCGKYKGRTVVDTTPTLETNETSKDKA